METQVTDRAAMADIEREARVRSLNALVLREPDMKWLDIPREQLVSTLGASLYPGAKPASIKMVLDYCEAAGLNVMLKPVHIVPMSVKKPGGGRNDYEYRDVVMPGINHYRTQASRTGTYLGKTEPEWGPAVEKTWGEFKMTVPEWCKVTVKRLVGTHVAEFTAVEFWDENYATKGKDSTTPNAMWQKRPKGQLHKCTEAQALRMAFPELVGTETAEEMEGKVIDLTADEVTQQPKAAVRQLDQFAGTDATDEGAGGDDQGEREEEGQVEVIDETPRMPEAAYDAFYHPAEGKAADWHAGWKWLNEMLEANAYTQAVRTQIGTAFRDLLWAVHDKGGNQQKAVLAFCEKHGIIVPPKKAK